MRTVALYRSISLIVLAAFLAAGLFGQTFTGTITGTVTDTSNAAIPGAAVTLTNTVTGDVRRGAANETGRFTFSQMPPSSYRLNVSHQGFREYVRQDIPLDTNRSIDLHVELSVGDLTQKLEVTATAALLDTQTANKAVTIGQEALRELPLNARNVLGMVGATSGVIGVKTGVVADQNQNRFAMAGGRYTSNAVLVDGISVVSGDWGGAIGMPGVDAVQELQVIRNTYEAQFGRTGGGVINISTRSGSPQFHGQVSEYLNNDNLNANGFFNNKFGARQDRIQAQPVRRQPGQAPSGIHGGYTGSSPMKACAPVRPPAGPPRSRPTSSGRAISRRPSIPTERSPSSTIRSPPRRIRPGRASSYAPLSPATSFRPTASTRWD